MYMIEKLFFPNETCQVPHEENSQTPNTLLVGTF